MELPALPPVDPAEFALRVAARPDPGAWSLLVVPIDEVAPTAIDLVREIETLEGHAPVLVSPRGGGARFVAEVERYASETIVAAGVDGFTRDDWEELDLARSRLLREGEVVVVLGPDAAAELLRRAPHLASWVSSFAWTSNAEALRAEHERRKAERLADLRAWAPSMTDDDVVRLAEQGRIPGEPEYAEWLVLLGRGDLLGSR